MRVLTRSLSHKKRGTAVDALVRTRIGDVSLLVWKIVFR
jgi:hypothetical protein